MTPFTHKRSPRTAFALFVLLMAATAVSIITVPHTQAGGLSCAGSSWSVGSESQLNQAIDCYNNKTVPGNYTISLTQNILLTSFLFDIDNTLAATSLLLVGNNFAVDGQGSFQVFTIAANTTTTIQNMTITRGDSFSGGGIDNEGTLTVSNSTLSHNLAEDGGGIYNEGTLTVSNSTLSDNTAEEDGGGIYNWFGTLTVSNSTLSHNSADKDGGGIYNFGTLTVSNSTLSDNSADGDGGGISNNTTLTVSNSTFSENSANHGGGIYNGGTLTVSNSTFSENVAEGSGGGIDNDGTLTVSNSTLSDNFAGFYGGGITNADTLTVSNSTFSGNSTVNDGGGIKNDFGGTATIDSSTFSGNVAGAGGSGIKNGDFLTISNTIVTSINKPDCFNDGGTVTDNGHNIVEDNSCGFTGGVDPKLGPLANNGGPTQTHALLSGSPAIDAGNTTLTTDQRGFVRPYGSADDIGAFEVSPYKIYLPMIVK